MLKEENAKVEFDRSGILPTPPLPAELKKVSLTENAHQVFARRYVRRDANSEPVEEVEETFWRVAYHVAKVESEWGNDVEKIARSFYE